MTRLLLHRSVVRDDLRRLRKVNAPAADAALDFVWKLSSSPQRGRRLNQPGWRAYEVEPGIAVIAAGVGSGTIRVLGLGPLPTVYDPARLRSMAEAAVAEEGNSADLEPGVPPPAARSRIVTLAQADETRSYRDPGPGR